MVHDNDKENDMKSPVKKTIVTGAIVAVLALSGAGAAVAATTLSAPAGASDTAEHDSSFVGSVKAPAETKDANEAAEGPEDAATEAADDAAEKADDAAEAAALTALAKITPDQASAAASKAVAGKAGIATLDEENGFVVYEVDVTAADGTITEVTIDAGNGSVLAQEKGDANEPHDD